MMDLLGALGFPLVCFLADTLPRIRMRRVDSGISVYLDRTAYGMWYRSPTK